MRICLITFSDNADHQNTVYSMFNMLKEKVYTITIGITNPKSAIAPISNNNYYVNCPKRPGITVGAFRISTLMQIVRIIRKEHIDLVYFESQHIWNPALMILCKNIFSVQAVHDVIPHDGNTGMLLSNYISSHLADHVILRNGIEKELLSYKYRLKNEKITCFELWREFPQETPYNNSSVFLFFGRIRTYKGLEKLVRLAQKTPKIQYRVIGEPDQESQDVVRRLDALENVSVVAHEVSDEEMSNEFANADWILLPYSSATQSGVIVDSYRYSRPVIAYDVGAIQEQVIDGETGFLIPKDDEEALRKAVEKANLMSDTKKREFAHNAYEFGKKKYAADSVADRFLDVLYSVATNHQNLR